MVELLTSEVNPLLEGLRLRRRPDPCIIVIYGASGDLASRKLIPALYALGLRHLLPEHFAILGVARSEGSDESFRTEMKEAISRFARDGADEEAWARMAPCLYYVSTDFGDSGMGQRVEERLREIAAEHGTEGNCVHYFSVPPSVIPVLVEQIGSRRDPLASGWTRLIVEKPFGSDRASAHSLNDELHRYFDEREIYRIDHYLGKETVQNLLALRFANGIFEPIWNRQFVDHVEITVAESIGIEGRSAFYEHAGAIRDVFQNHLLQLVALTAMEPPVDFSAESVRNEKVKVLRALRLPRGRDVVRGQYGPGYIEGRPVPGYRQEPGVAAQSTTDTFVAARLQIDNWRWADTPFYVRVGKRLPKRETTIAIQFQRAPHPPFAKETAEGMQPNVLVVHVQPDEGVSLAIGAKVPGQGLTIRTVVMNFLYGAAFRTELPEAYERLILDCLLGDATLFTRADEVDAQWALVDSIVGRWKREKPSFPNYAAGTWGPPEADELIRREGREWRRR